MAPVSLPGSFLLLAVAEEVNIVLIDGDRPVLPESSAGANRKQMHKLNGGKQGTPYLSRDCQPTKRNSLGTGRVSDAKSTDQLTKRMPDMNGKWLKSLDQAQSRRELATINADLGLGKGNKSRLKVDTGD